MKTLMMVVVFVGIFCVPVQGEIYLIFNGKNTNARTVNATSTNEIAVTTTDKGFTYDAILGFYKPDEILGRFQLVQVTGNAGGGADIVTVELPSVKGYHFWSGIDPMPGKQFVFEYQPMELGNTMVQLIDFSTGKVIDTLELTVVDPVVPRPVDHVFTYQGRLNDEGSPADGIYDMEFALFADSSHAGFGEIGLPVLVDNVQVAGGYFTARLDFGNGPEIFNGDKRWLEISVRPGDSNNPADFRRLSPRQQLFATPYASHALTTANDELIDQMADQIALLSDQVGQLTSLLAGVSRTDDTIQFSGVNVQIVNGQGSTGSSNGKGNLIVGYNESRGTGDVRDGSHSIVMGMRNNFSAYGSLINGYNNTAEGAYCTVFGQYNSATSSYASVTGGLSNLASSVFASVTGGRYNVASGYASTVTGGGGNSAVYGNTASGQYATVHGGLGNVAHGTRGSVLGGGNNHASGDDSTVAGGLRNEAGHLYSVVAGGVDKATTKNYQLSVSRAPDYNSGWFSLARGASVTLNHNLGGNANNYKVELDMDSDFYMGLNQYHLGGGKNGADNYGIYWRRLTDESILVVRNSEDLYTFYVRIRIWKD